MSPASPVNKDVDPYRVGEKQDSRADNRAAVTSEIHIQFTLAQALLNIELMFGY